jgi:hypothetical protein
LALVQALHQALGFAPPDPAGRAGEDDVTMLDVMELFRGAGVGDEATLRLLAVYADGVRRIAKAEADYYEANIERRLRASGLDERQLIEFVDLTGYTQLTEERGDEVAANVAGRLASLVTDRSRHFPGRGRLREDGEPGRQDRLVRSGRTGPRERGHRAPLRPPRPAIRAAGAHRIEGRRPAPAALPNLPHILSAERRSGWRPTHQPATTASGSSRST